MGQYAYQLKLSEKEGWLEAVIQDSEANAFSAFSHYKSQGEVEAVAVLARKSADKPWTVIANARKKFGYVC